MPRRFLFPLVAALCGCIAAAEPRTPMSREAAIAAAIGEYPELAAYRTASLPPHSIEAQRAPGGGWNVAFIRSGSGLDSILHARCYRVDRSGEVTPTGTFARSGRDVRRLELATCRPATGP